MTVLLFHHLATINPRNSSLPISICEGFPLVSQYSTAKLIKSATVALSPIDWHVRFSSLRKFESWAPHVTVNKDLIAKLCVILKGH